MDSFQANATTDREDGEAVLAVDGSARLLRPLAATLALPGIRLVCALVSAGLLAISFPDFDFSAVAWIAVVPLAVACEGTSWRVALGLGLLAGMAATLASCGWIFNVPGIGWVQALPIALYLGLYPAAWCAGLVVFRRSRAPLAFSGAALWVALDFLRAHAGFLATSWMTLAQSQHTDLSLLQVAAFTGEAGVTFAVVMVNLALTDALTHRRWKPFAVAAAVVAALHLGGAAVLAGGKSGTALQVAVIQPAITARETRTDRGWNAGLERLERLTRAAAASLPKPALIVWPERVVRDLDASPALEARLQRLARRQGVPILLGSSDLRVVLSGSSSGFRIDTRNRNAAWMIPAHGPVPAPYYKMELLPFGEYLPLARWVRWPRWLVPWSLDTLRGHRRALFRIGGGLRVAPILCWENEFAGRVRRSVTDGARVIVQLVNENWLGRSAGPRQHALASVMRAVENRVPVVVASDTGPSEIIGRTGSVLARGPDLFDTGFVAARVRAGSGSFYSAHGDLFAWLCVAAAILWIGLGLAARLRGKAAALLVKRAFAQRPAVKGEQIRETRS